MTLDTTAARLEGLLAKADPGKLIACGWGDGSTQMGMTNIFDTRDEALLMECMPEDVATLIVEAVNALPALLSERRALKDEVARLRACDA